MEQSSTTKRWGRLRNIVIAVVGGAAGAFLATWALGRIDCRVAYALVTAALPLVPVALAIEGARIVVEALAARSLFRAMKSDISFPVLARAHWLGYSVCNVAPIGRMASEVTKATVLSAHAPLATTSAVATVAQALNLLASACILVPCIVAARSTHASLALSATLMGQVVVLSTIGGGLLLGAYFLPVHGGLVARIPKLGRVLHPFRSAMRKLPSFPWRALAWLVFNRLLQIGLLAVLIHAIGASFSLARPFVALAVVITGASAFDFVPGQVGALEGAFGLFAPALQLGGPAAIAIALLMHLVQFTWVFFGVSALVVARKRSVRPAIANTSMPTVPLAAGR